MTTTPVHTEGEPPGAPIRLPWFTPAERRSVRFALVIMLLGSLGSLSALVGAKSGVSHWLAMKVQWHLYHRLSLDLFERCLIGIPAGIAALGVVMLTVLVLPALYRRLPPRPKRIVDLICLLTYVMSIAMVVIGVGIHSLRQTQTAESTVNSDVRQVPTLRQQFHAFMSQNEDWVLPLAYLTVVCLLAVIAWTLIAILRRQRSRRVPFHSMVPSGPVRPVGGSTFVDATQKALGSLSTLGIDQISDPKVMYYLPAVTSKNSACELQQRCRRDVRALSWTSPTQRAEGRRPMPLSVRALNDRRHTESHALSAARAQTPRGAQEFYFARLNLKNRGLDEAPSTFQETRKSSPSMSFWSCTLAPMPISR